MGVRPTSDCTRICGPKIQQPQKRAGNKYDCIIVYIFISFNPYVLFAHITAHIHSKYVVVIEILHVEINTEMVFKLGHGQYNI